MTQQRTYQVTRRRLALTGVPVVVLAFVWSLGDSVTGQTPVVTPKPTGVRAIWTPHRTPWGDPDLEGIYNNASAIPLQRPTEFDKSQLNDEEAEAWQQRLRETINTDNTPRDRVGNYNEHWFDPRRKELAGDKRTSLIVDPSDGRIPPRVRVSPEREKRRADVVEANRRYNAGMPNSWLDLAPEVRCISRNDKPPYLGIIYNNTYQIFQSPQYVAIAVEMIHSTRIIPLDGRSHLRPHFQNWLGDARGHWEGTTLIVDTTNFREEGVYGYDQGAGLGEQSANASTYHLTERFTLAGPDTLKYEFTVSDPQTWTRPWTAMAPWARVGIEEQLYEYECHEHNYDIVHLLAGGRARERAGETLDDRPTSPGDQGR